VELPYYFKFITRSLFITYIISSKRNVLNKLLWLEKMNNCIIAIEGIDGSGKGTQSKLLEKYFINHGYDVKLFSFPRYTETFFGKEVGNYLNGSYGSINQINPKLAAMLYAGDRYETKNKILYYLKKGYILIFDRYVSSNVAHHVAKLPEEERSSFIKWIYDLEYSVYKLPKPNIEIFLNIPFDYSRQMVAKKSQRKYTNCLHDIHEKDENYLKKVSEIYFHIAKQNNWVHINCFIEKTFRDKEDILKEIVCNLEEQLVNKIIN